MIDMTHPQLDPLYNRTRKPRAAAAPDTAEYPRVDPTDPYRNTYLGIIDLPVTDGRGERRPGFLYIPTTEKSAWNMVLVLVPGGRDPRDFFEAGDWQQILERHCATGYFLSAPRGWNRQEPGLELEAAVAALGIMRANRYFQSNAPAVYCMGFGDSAWVASLFAVTHVSVLAAWSAAGDTELDQELLDRLGDGPSDCDAALPRRAVTLPTCVFDNRESNVVRYFKDANHTADEGLKNAHGRVFRQQDRPAQSYRNDTVCCEVWHGPEIHADPETMMAFMEGYKRWGGEGNGHIRRTVYPEACGMVKTETEVDGLKRHWWTFAPSAHRRDPEKKLPLVIAIHGFTCSGEFFMNNTDWHWVGEERGAFVVFPTAYPFHRETPGPMGTRIATPEWNAGGMGDPADPVPEGPDELRYFKELLRRTLAEYPVDTTRIYVTGHSNGAMMTQRLMRCMPEVFAAFAPVGFMEAMRGNMRPEPEDGILRPVWYHVGEFDGLGCDLSNEEHANNRTIRFLCDHNKAPYEGRRDYHSGIYMHSVWKDAQGIPLVRFTGIKNWPHTYTPEQAFMIYDEFFAHFRRLEDGSLEYLG